MSEEMMSTEATPEEATPEEATPKKTSGRGRRRTREEKIEALDVKIKDLENKLQSLYAQREELVNPTTFDTVIAAAQKKGISPKKMKEMIDQYLA